MSILGLWVTLVFAFCIVITVQARRQQSINTARLRSVYLLLAALFVWTLTAIGLGIQGIHTSKSLLEKVPLLWQACVPVAIVGAASLFRTVRHALRGIAASTPWIWLVFIQALRIGALGGVAKGLKGEITSSYVYWVGIPDFLFGASAIVVGWLLLRGVVGRRFLMIWSLVGAAIILLPTFAFMNYWMNEPGFMFIFEFPMVLAPSIVVPMLVLLNFLLAWGVSRRRRSLTPPGDCDIPELSFQASEAPVGPRTEPVVAPRNQS